MTSPKQNGGIFKKEAIVIAVIFLAVLLIGYLAARIMPFFIKF